MSTKLKLCKTCGSPCESGYCSRHRKPQPLSARSRESKAKRGYDNKWSRFSLRLRRARPWCEDCKAKGRWQSSEEVHHIQKVCDRPDLKFELTNLMCLCRRCHAIRSGRGE